MINTPIHQGLLQSDLDCAHFQLLNFAGGGGGLDANTVVASDIGLIGDGLTDNTTALQTWINSVQSAKVNSTLLVPDGIYIFSGPLQDASYRNAQILLPTVAITDPTYSITIKGYHPVSYIPWPDATMPTPKGPIFRSTLSTGGGAQPSFIGGKGPSGGIGPDLSYLCVRFENMIFQTVQNPLISCLNLSHFSVVELGGDVLIMAGSKLGETDSVEPTTATSYGLILPPNNYGMVQKINNVVSSNFYTGVLMGELTHIVNMACQLCHYALEFQFAFHITLIERIVDWHCKNGIRMTGEHNFQVNQYDVERAPDGRWYSRVYDVDDITNVASADIVWRTVIAFVGVSHTFTINGGTGVRAREAGGGPQPNYPTPTTLNQVIACLQAAGLCA